MNRGAAQGQGAQAGPANGRGELQIGIGRVCSGLVQAVAGLDSCSRRQVVKVVAGAGHAIPTWIKKSRIPTSDHSQRFGWEPVSSRT